MVEKLTKSSMADKLKPPVEKIIGKLEAAIFSRRGQSCAEQLATFIRSNFMSSI